MSNAVITQSNVFPMFTWIFETRCAIWHHLYNLKNLKSTHRDVLFLVFLQTDCTDGTKSRNAPHFVLSWLVLINSSINSHTIINNLLYSAVMKKFYRNKRNVLFLIVFSVFFTVLQTID